MLGINYYSYECVNVAALPLRGGIPNRFGYVGTILFMKLH
jgi:hypothetical protein